MIGAGDGDRTRRPAWEFSIKFDSLADRHDARRRRGAGAGFMLCPRLPNENAELVTCDHESRFLHRLFLSQVKPEIRNADH
jgi:hypothetical protein